MSTAAEVNSCLEDIDVNNDAGRCGAEVNYTVPTVHRQSNLTQSGSNSIRGSVSAIPDCSTFSILRAYNLPALGITNGFTVNSVAFAALTRGNSPVTVKVYQ